jgi:hypothetical protein
MQIEMCAWRYFDIKDDGIEHNNLGEFSVSLSSTFHYQNTVLT